MSYNKETGMYEGYIYKIVNDVNDKVYIGQTISTIAERWHGHMSAALNEKRCKSALYNAMRKYGREKFYIHEIINISYPTKDELIENLNKLEQDYILQYKSLTSQNGYNVELGGNNKKVAGRKVNKYDVDLNYICSYESCEEAGRQNSIDGCTIYGCCKHQFYTAGGYVWAFDGEKPVKPHYKQRCEYNRKIVEKKPYVSKALPKDIKRKRKLLLLGWNGQRIFQYNSYGDIINIFDDLIDASEKLETSTTEIKKNLTGKNLHFNKTVLRYESDSFDKFPRSKQLQAITLYDLQGNFIANFETQSDAEQFIGCPRGEITKTLKRGGSCKNYLIAKYGEPLNRKTYRWEKTIEMCDDRDNVVKEFATISKINEYFNIIDCHHSLNKAIKNKTKYRGYYWRYKEEFAITA